MARYTAANLAQSIVHVLGFDFQLFLAGFADPVVFAFDEGVEVDTFSVVGGADVAFHERDSIRARVVVQQLRE